MKDKLANIYDDRLKTEESIKNYLQVIRTTNYKDIGKE